MSVNNTVNDQSTFNYITIVNPDSCRETVEVSQPLVNVIEVATVGPSGATGAIGANGSSQPFSNVSGSIWATTSSIQITGSFTVSGSSTFTNIGLAVFTGSVVINGYSALTSNDTGSFLISSSFNSFSSSYYVDSGSVSNRITNLELFSSSLDSTFATDSQLNSATASLSSSISSLNSSFQLFSGSYNTGSFTGVFYGTSSWSTNSITASYAPDYVLNASTSSMLQPYVLNSSTSSFVLNSQTSSMTVLSSSFSLTASFINPLNQNVSVNGNVSVTGSIYIPDNTYGIYFSGSSTTSKLIWNDTDGTLDLGLKGGNVTLQIGQKQVVRIVNKTGISLTAAAYQVVKISGAQGNRLKVALALGDSDVNSADTIGIVTEDISLNQEGFVTNSGLVRSINTTGALQGETWNDGDVLYLSPTTAGAITNIKPQAPQHTVILGFVVNAHPTQGAIFVKVDNGYEIDELHNVRITSASLTAGNLLVRNSNNVWVNSNQLTGSYFVTGSVSATSFTGSLFGTASSALTASYVNTLNQNLSIFGNLLVFGTASFTQITGSILQAGTSTIILNTDNPAVRFGGISVVDSGSFGTSSTGSLLWDSQNNRWVYSNPSGSAYDGGMLISGPRNTSGLGNESGMDANFVAVGQGADHIRPGSIYNSGSVTVITGSLTVTQGITGSLFGTASLAINAVTASYINPTFISASAAASGFGSGGSSGITVGTTTITGGTSGRIPFNSGSVYGESANLFWDNTNNYLTLTSNAATTGPTLRLYDTNASGRNFEISNANGANYATMYWKVGASAGAAPSTTLMTLTNSGYLALGLGNTNGSYPLDIGGSGVGGTLVRVKGNSTNHDLLIGNSTNNAFIGAYSGAFQIFTQGNLSFPALSITYGTSPKVGIGTGVSSPTAVLHLTAGTATANTAPLKLTSGTNLTTPEAGSVEYNGTDLFFTPSSTRNILAQISGSTSLATGSITFVTTNGYLTGSSGLTWNNTNKQIISSTDATYEYPIIATRETNSANLGGGIKLNAYDGSNASVPYASFISRIENNSSTASVRKGGFSLRVFNNTTAVTGAEGLDDAIIGYSDKRIGIGGVNSYSNCAMQINTNTTAAGVFIFGTSTSSRILLGRGVSSGEFAQLQYNASTDNLIIGSSNNLTNHLVLTNAGRNIGMSVTTPTALLHLAAGTATANTGAPLKFTSGTNLTTPEAGSMEYNGTNLFFTPSSAVRNILTQVTGSTALTSGNIPFATTNGYLTGSSNLFWDNTNTRVGIGTSSPNYAIHSHVSTGANYMQWTNNATGITASDGLIVGLNSSNQGNIETQDATNILIRPYSTTAATFGNTGNSSLRLAINAAVSSLGTNSQLGVFGTLSTTSLNSQFMNSNNDYIMWVDNSRAVSIKLNAAPTAILHIGAGSATANTAPLKFTSGTNLTTPEAGSVEYNGTDLFFTPSSTRNILTQVTGSTALTSGNIPFATTNGYLTGNSRLSWNNSTNELAVSGTLNIGNGNAATAVSESATSNYLLFNNNNSQIYDDGNLHIHSRGSGQTMWINTNGGQLNILSQSPGSGAVTGSGVGIGTGTLVGYVTIDKAKSYSTSAGYGYLTTGGAGVYGGGAQTLQISLYAASRIWGQEIDAFSDERMKNIQGEVTLDEGLKLINNLKPIKYTWKEGEDKGLKVGYSAQQVSKAGFDHLISLAAKPGLEETIDDTGFLSPKDTQFSMNYDQVTPYHGVVIKHLLDKINALEIEIQKLKNQS